jgi:type III restriction enzyme
VTNQPPSPASWIAKQPDRCGGEAGIRDSRIPVWILANYRRLGGCDANLLRDYPSLTPADLEAAWSYAAAHVEEIDQAIRQNETGENGPVE